MSLSNPIVSNKRPVDWYVQWNGGLDKGYFSRYEKGAQGQTGTNHKVDLKNLIVLDKDLFSITGFRERDKASIQSNEVRSVFIDPNAVLEINSWNKGVKTLEKKGTYKNLKDEMKDIPYFNYTACIYGYLPDEDKVIHLQLSGIANSQFGKIDGVGEFETHYLNHTDTKQDKKGSIEFKLPVFTWGDKFSADHLAKAVPIDVKIQAYLKAYLKGAVIEELAHDDDHTSQAEPEFDIRKWREFEYTSGKKLGELKRQGIKDLQDELANSNSEGVLMDCVGQALYDYQAAEKTWDSMKDKNGRAITDYNLEELEAAYAQIPPHLEQRTKVEIAIEVLKEAEKKAGSDPEPEGNSDASPF